ncbi:MAG: hypothetical protein IKD69_11585 [Solobacterium sp.]|nr:hypothetical protein [Solobacterium sp.]
MKDIFLNGISWLNIVPCGTSEWYFGRRYDAGDLDEAKQIYEDRHVYPGCRLVFVHYPDGRVLEPLQPRINTWYSEPIHTGGILFFLVADFEKNTLAVMSFDPGKQDLREETVLTLPDDCVNLMLHGETLTLSRPTDTGLELLWPDVRHVPTGERESFFFRRDEKLYFMHWVEDPDYRVDIVVRDTDGNIVENMPGDIMIMPDGQLWHLS